MKTAKLVLLFLLGMMLISIAQAEVNVTKQEAIDALNKSSAIISELQSNGFPVKYMNDTLIEARRVFEQARYAEILKTPSSSNLDKNEARSFLKLIDWQSLSYNEVINYTSRIQQRKDETLELYDEIYSLQFSSKDLADSKVNNSINLAWEAFYDERFDDARVLIEQTKTLVEDSRTIGASVTSLKENALNFFQRNYLYIIGSLIFLAIIGYLAYRVIRIKNLRARIIRLEFEEKALVALIKSTQEDRFNKNKISGIVYNIRIKKYQEKLDEVKRDLLVLYGVIKKG